MIFKTSFIAAAALCLSALTAQAHVGLSRPCGRYSPAKGCPAPPPGQSIDYDINAPIGTHDRINAPICKKTTPYAKRTTYKAGQTIKTEYSVGAAHGGGHCQWALSYDNGKTWVVIKTMLRDCLKGVNGGQPYSVPVTIPAGAPSGKATFQWIWNNAVGNREMYSNCADIIIKGKAGGSISGVAPLYANYGPKSVLIPEFGGPNSPDGSEAFAKRKRVTITVGKAAAPKSKKQPKKPKQQAKQVKGQKGSKRH
ncbi:hypothetical protein BGZ68_009084 [Mortierella alpina]|nr:hypothetical protein BGZ68_009084 [Mortierella alpina]